MSDSYYNSGDLKKFSKVAEFQPQLAEKFFSYYGAVFAEGALTAREKSLIALLFHMQFSVPIVLMPILQTV